MDSRLARWHLRWWHQIHLHWLSFRWLLQHIRILVSLHSSLLLVESQTDKSFSGITDAFCGADCFNLAGLCSADMSGSGTINRPKATHVPWKPTVHHDPHFKPSYVIDNGERAPNQVWSWFWIDSFHHFERPNMITHITRPWLRGLFSGFFYFFSTFRLSTKLFYITYQRGVHISWTIDHHPPLRWGFQRQKTTSILIPFSTLLRITWTASAPTFDSFLSSVIRFTFSQLSGLLILNVAHWLCIMFFSYSLFFITAPRKEPCLLFCGPWDERHMPCSLKTQTTINWFELYPLLQNQHSKIQFIIISNKTLRSIGLLISFLPCISLIS